MSTDTFVCDMGEEKTEHILSDLQPYILKESDKQKKNFLAYLHPFSLEKNVAIVDIGWKGSSQHFLQRILDEAQSDVHTIGLYWGSFFASDNPCEKHGFLCSPEDPKRKLEVLNAGFVFENVLSASTGSTESYQIVEGKAEPILDAGSCFAEESIQEAQKGIHAFFETFLSLRKIVPVYFGESAIDAMFATLNRPSKILAESFGEIRFKDGDMVRYVAKPQSLMHYFLHQKDLISDIHYCGWNSAFCRRLIPFPLPWFSMYSFIKKIRK